MKLTKLMLSALVAASALVACNKENPAPETGRLKTVEISLDNIFLTKGEAGTKINENDPVKVTDFKIFLTDGTGNIYTGKVAGGTTDAQDHFTAADFNFATGSKLAEFHYVDPKCTKVVVVGNTDLIDADPDNVTLAAVKAYKAEIGTQQKQDDLLLYAEQTLGNPVSTESHVVKDENGNDYTAEYQVYEVNLTLKPMIARFEVDGFKLVFNDPSKYASVQVTDLAFMNYNSKAMLATGVLSDLVQPIPDLSNQTNVYSWFNTPANAGWFRDSFTGIEMTPAAPYGDFGNDDKAYHFFAGDNAPALVVKLLVDGLPAYVYATSYTGETGTIGKLEPGKIYRMSAAGEVHADNPDGYIPIDEDDLDPMDRCLDIKVDVMDWTVELITPEF